MKPALTKEEWSEIEQTACIECYTHDKKIPVDRFTEPEDISRHALAALCLHNQEYGFTKEDVGNLEIALTMNSGSAEHMVALESIQLRIEALLPPEPEEPSNGP